MLNNQRNISGFKDSINMYRKNGERVCYVDGLTMEITRYLVKMISVAGFKVWRTGDTVWVRTQDADAICSLGINADKAMEELLELRKLSDRILEEDGRRRTAGGNA